MPNVRSSAIELRFVCAGKSRRIAPAWSCFYGPPTLEPDADPTWMLRGWDLATDQPAEFRMSDITKFYP